MKIGPVLGISLLLNLLAGFFADAEEITPPDPARIKAYQEMLPQTPRGIGPTIEDRRTWEKLAKHPGAAKIIQEAEGLLKTPMPELTDDLFLEYSRNGNRTRFQAVAFERHDRLCKLVLAECLENRGRFLPGIEQAIAEVCSEKTWVLPAHDIDMRNFKGEEIEIDLFAAGFGWNLATADYWLADKLTPAARKLIAAELQRRIFTPFTKMVTTGKPRLWWLTITNNWNAVCLAGVTGAALTTIESPARRAFFAAAAEKYIEYFLKGFTPDGYCSEGVGYWNYGFGHFVRLAETIKQATDGKVDMLAPQRIRPIALYGRRMEIIPGVYPSFADAQIGVKPDPRLMGFLSRRFGFGWRDFEKMSAETDVMIKGRLFELGIYGLGSSSAEAGPNMSSPAQPLRDWFPDAGVLVCRPRSGNAHALGAALKGGHNAEHHNHNDIGSFVVALGKSTPLLDPGSEIYTARTFSGRRYESNVINSFGHSVPRVAGTLQVTGREAQAKILKTLFTDAEDTLVMDISSAYKVPDLKKLERTFVFSREGKGKLTVTDDVEFNRPQTFETALVTFSKWKQTTPDRLEIGEGEDVVEAIGSATGGTFRISAEEIKEDLPGHKIPVRVGIALIKPAQKATVTVTITPK